VDKISLLHQLHPDRDLVMRGNVTHVGKSSMEICIEVFSKITESNREEKLIDAVFTMVARGPDGKAAMVNPLEPETPEEKATFAQGELNKQRRLEASKMSLTKTAPTADERFVIHDLFMRKDLKNWIEMNTTRHETLILCQPSVST
jgi:acyl-coenzyme A thioesterase 9